MQFQLKVSKEPSLDFPWLFESVPGSKSMAINWEQFEPKE